MYRSWVRIGLAFVVTLSFCHLLALSSSEAEPEELSYAERVLRKAGAATDGAGLLAFIRTRTLSETQRKGLADKVRILGAADYAEREDASRALVTLGRVALPYLRAAVNDPDLEISRRARRCIERIQRNPNPSLLALAALLVKSRRPSGAASVLLDYLPNVEDETLEETWLDALRAVAWRDGRIEPALRAALTDKRAVYRAAAAHVLGRGEDASLRKLVLPLLGDVEARVRFESAAGLVRFGDKNAVPVLVALLDDGPFPLACRAEYLLRLLADTQGPEASLDKDDNAVRRRCRTDWETWWKKHAARVDLTRLKAEEPSRGLIDVCEDGEDDSRVWEAAQAGQVCWELLHLDGAHDVHALPNDRILIAEQHANRITERGRNGKIYWEQETTGNPIACQRLANGNTLIVTYKALYEVTREHKEVFRHTDRRDFRDARRLPNGHILYITGDGTLLERDATCEHLLHCIQMEDYGEGANYRARVEPLLNGRFLLALGGRDRVVEIDGFGKIRWEYSVRKPMSATRLRNGHTLIASFEDRCILEVDRAGKEIEKRTLQGRPFVVRRR